jgi:hypothetical protein
MKRLVSTSLMLVQVATCVVVGLVHAAPLEQMIVISQPSPRRAAAPSRAEAPVAIPISRAGLPVVTVSATGPGQAGYVHYFVITGPDGEPETQVGIELADDRIAWSFPDIGVVISPFIASGTIIAQGKRYDVQHLYGIRPFPDDRSLRGLQQELSARIARWVDSRTPFCDEERPPNEVCVSCLGFVLRVLYPSSSSVLAAVPVLPPDFKSARKNVYTTEDLLIYLSGIPIDASRHTRLARIETLAIPETLREQLVRISSQTDSSPTVEAPIAATPVATKPRPVSRSTVDLPKRVLVRRRS